MKILYLYRKKCLILYCQYSCFLERPVITTKYKYFLCVFFFFSFPIIILRLFHRSRFTGICQYGLFFYFVLFFFFWGFLLSTMVVKIHIFRGLQYMAWVSIQNSTFTYTKETHSFYSILCYTYSNDMQQRLKKDTNRDYVGNDLISFI